MTRQEIHQKVIEHYGELAQINKCQEELRELSDALSNCEFLSGTGTKAGLRSEIADVLNCIHQQIIIHGLEGEEVSEEQDYKMNRTLERMKI